MIHTSTQLKALVRNKSKASGINAEIIMRNYFVERFLERLALSSYRNNFILKGGALISNIVGIDTRSTMDIDATVKGALLSKEWVQIIIRDIVSVYVDDGVTFEIKNISAIMDEANYSGIRVKLKATLDKMNMQIKLDLSTGDIITPKEVEYQYSLTFEERNLSVLSYTLETVLAEKLESIFTRGIANTRMRDFYDIYVLNTTRYVNSDVLRKAFTNTSKYRGSNKNFTIENVEEIVDEIENSSELIELWKRYQKRFDYSNDVSWNDIINSIQKMVLIIL